MKDRVTISGHDGVFGAKSLDRRHCQLPPSSSNSTSAVISGRFYAFGLDQVSRLVREPSQITSEVVSFLRGRNRGNPSAPQPPPPHSPPHHPPSPVARTR
jgi:hypothetical protein